VVCVSISEPPLLCFSRRSRIQEAKSQYCVAVENSATQYCTLDRIVETRPRAAMMICSRRETKLRHRQTTLRNESHHGLRPGHKDVPRARRAPCNRRGRHVEAEEANDHVDVLDGLVAGDVVLARCSQCRRTTRNTAAARYIQYTATTTYDHTHRRHSVSASG
jgi:hypothetical protein